MHLSPVSIAIATAVVLISVTPGDANGAGKKRWYDETLESGETRGYHWSLEAKGLRNEPLREVCTEVGLIEPPDPETLYFEGNGLTVCGLLGPTRSVSASTELGSGESQLTVYGAIYHPAVRKVSVVFENGEREVYRPTVPQIPKRAAKGVPMFRYLVALFDGKTCMERITTFDVRGAVLNNDKAEAPCSGAP